ncbi:MAG TPA: hypothetical protein VFP32_02265 [Candidatus Saccharimonadales bacterium]|nr:hypothetical protein [Candidatus Saccharimonadales bacterium]
MAKKFISLATGIVILDVYLQSQLQPKGILFYFASDNIVFNLGLLVLAIALVGLAFKNKFKHWQSFVVCAAAAVILSVIGAAGLFFLGIGTYFFNYLVPFDFLILLQSGIILGLHAMTIKHEPAKLRLPAALAALPVPDYLIPIFHTPRVLGRLPGKASSNLLVYAKAQLAPPKPQRRATRPSQSSPSPV